MDGPFHCWAEGLRKHGANLKEGLLVAHTVSKKAVHGGAARLRAQEDIAVWQHHALQELHVVLPRAIAHIHRAAAHLHRITGT